MSLSYSQRLIVFLILGDSVLNTSLNDGYSRRKGYKYLSQITRKLHGTGGYYEEEAILICVFIDILKSLKDIDPIQDIYIYQ